MDIAGFLDQAEEYETRGDVRDSLLKLLQISSRATRSPRCERPSCRSGQPGRNTPRSLRGTIRAGPMTRTLP